MAWGLEVAVVSRAPGKKVWGIMCVDSYGDDLLAGGDKLEGSRRETNYVDLRGDLGWTKTEVRARGMRIFCNVGCLLGNSIFLGYAWMGLLRVGGGD